jgi:tetratricopeptide (TPR) repeat protein
MGKLEASVAQYKEILAARPDFYVSWESLAYVYALQEDYAEADRSLEALVADAPAPSARTGARWFKALFDYFLGRWDKALAEYLAIEGEVDKGGGTVNAWPAYWMTAFIYTDRGEYDLALKAFETYNDAGIKRNPANLTFYRATGRYFRGWVELARGRVDEARAELKEMEPLLPGVDPANMDLVAFLHSLLAGEIALAGNSSEEAVAAGERIVPRAYASAATGALASYNIPFLKDILARAYWKKGDLDRAEAEYRMLMTIDPANQVRYLIHPLYHSRLGRVLEEKGDRDGARAEYRKFLEYWKDADSGHPELADAQKRLD